MINCWIDKQGNIYKGDFCSSHFDIAVKLFPNASNPEVMCEKRGMVKMGTMYNGSPMMEGYEGDERAPQAQVDAVHEVWQMHYKEKKRT